MLSPSLQPFCRCRFLIGLKGNQEEPHHFAPASPGQVDRTLQIATCSYMSAWVCLFWGMPNVVVCPCDYPWKSMRDFKYCPVLFNLPDLCMGQNSLNGLQKLETFFQPAKQASQFSRSPTCQACVKMSVAWPVSSSSEHSLLASCPKVTAQDFFGREPYRMSTPGHLLRDSCI